MIHTKITKEQFISKHESLIQMRSVLAKFYKDNYFKVLKQFDGKVYNRKFIKALEDETNNYDNDLRIAQLDDNGYIRIDAYGVGRESLCMKLCLSGSRISFADTIAHKTYSTWEGLFNEETAEYQDVIDNYDKYLEITERLAALREEYLDIPYTFRYNIHKEFLTIY